MQQGCTTPALVTYAAVHGRVHPPPAPPAPLRLGSRSRRPVSLATWVASSNALAARRYELVTTAAAAALHSSYCTLAHGRILARDHLPPGDVAALVTAPDTADLPPVDRAIVAFATRVARGADKIDETDVDGLRAHGLADDEIFDVVLAAGARCFFSTYLDATGTRPDKAFAALAPELRDALTVGRPIEEACPRL